MRVFKTTVIYENVTRHNWDWDSNWIDATETIVLATLNPGFYNINEDGDRIFEIVAFTTELDIDLSQIEQITRSYFKTWGFQDVKSVKAKETDFLSATHELSVRSPLFQHLRRQFHCEELFLLLHDGTYFWDKIVEANQNPKALLKEAANSDYSDDLVAEIERIQSCSHETNHVMNLVHYLIEGNDPNLYQEPLDILTKSLSQYGRLRTDRVYTFEIDKMSNIKFYNHGYFENKTIVDLLDDAWVESLIGSTIVIKYGLFDEGSNYESDPYAVFSKTLELLNKHSKEIQVILVVPEDNPDLKERIRRKFLAPLIEFSRNQKINATDHDEAELLAVLNDQVTRMGLVPDEDLANILHEKLKDKSFSDIHEVLDEWVSLVVAKSEYPPYLPMIKKFFQRKSLLENKSSAYDRLQEMIGLKAVKEQITEVLCRFDMNQKLVRAGLKPQPFSMHLAFMGSPGTGKTEVARLYAEILKDKGILKEGRLIVRSGAEVWNVKDAFDEARGSVLFIDEAYGLSHSDKITELIAYMENRRRDTVVILAGYKNAIENLISSNPGFRSRIGFLIDFPDYSAEEKLEIFKFMVDHGGFKLGQKALSEARNVIERAGTPADEGNARYVRQLYENTVGSQQVRLAKTSQDIKFTEELLTTIEAEDVRTAAQKIRGEYWKEEIPGRQQLKDLIGLKEIKKMISQRLDFMHVQKVKRDAGIKAPFIPLHMAFLGNPGSGKTEVARVVAKILKDEGVLSVGKLIEVGGHELADPILIQAIFEKAKGSVIFVDEAYAMGELGQRSLSCISAFISCMENYREETVVILAGYKNEMRQLFALNPGFDSRIKIKIEFPDYSIDELVAILKLMAKRGHLTLADGVEDKARTIIKQASKTEGFGNARFVRNMFEDAIVAQGARLANDEDTLKTQDTKALTTLLPCDFVGEEKISLGQSFGFTGA